jgi:hypothetical protein
MKNLYYWGVLVAMLGSVHCYATDSTGLAELALNSKLQPAEAEVVKEPGVNSCVDAAKITQSNGEAWATGSSVCPPDFPFPISFNIFNVSQGETSGRQSAKSEVELHFKCCKTRVQYKQHA